MPLLMLTPRYSDDSINLRRAALASGWQVERLLRWSIPEGLEPSEVVIYGEPLFCEFASQKLGLAILEPTFDWPATLPFAHVKRKIAYTTLREAREYPEKVFAKPAEEKCFPPKVYTSGKAIPHLVGISDESTVLLSEPVTMQVEFRCFVLEREVVTISPYIRDGKLAQNEAGHWVASEEEYRQAADFAKSVLEDPEVKIPAGVVMDVGLTKEHGWVVVEANAAWSSGLCGCEPELVLSVLRRACFPKSELSEGDGQWLVQRVDRNV